VSAVAGSGLGAAARAAKSALLPPPPGPAFELAPALAAAAPDLPSAARVMRAFLVEADAAAAADAGSAGLAPPPSLLEAFRMHLANEVAAPPPGAALERALRGALRLESALAPAALAILAARWAAVLRGVGKRGEGGSGGTAPRR